MNDAIILRTKNYNKLDIKKMVQYVFNNFLNSSITKYDEVLIKPNLMYYWDSSTGETTDPFLVSCIIENIFDVCGKNTNIKIIESDASAMRTKYAFRILGYDKIINDNIELLNLSKGEHTIEKVSVRNKDIKIKINNVLKGDYYLINIPKLKIHRNPPILTCALKNNFGLISTPYKYQYHKNLVDYIMGINKIIKNDLIFLDGLVMLGKYPKKMGAVLATHDPITCDVISSKVCGINPKNDYIISKFLTKQHEYDTIDLFDPYDVMDGLIKDFPKTNPHFDKLLWDAQLYLLNLYTKIVGDIKPPILD